MVTNLLVLLFSLFSILILGYSLLLPVDSEIYNLLWYFDFVLCVFFIYDFFKQLFESKNKFKYLYTTGWLDLISSIPVIREMHLFRVFRIIRIIRIVRNIGSFNAIVAFIKEELNKSIFGLIVFAQVTIIFLSMFIVLYVEQNNGNIKTAEDTIWWTFITITTVGYGDLYPVTNVGRFVAIILIFTGIFSFGAVISYLSYWFKSISKS